MQVTKLSYLYNEHENTAGEIPAFTPQNFLVKKVYQLAQLVCQPTVLTVAMAAGSKVSPLPLSLTSSSHDIAVTGSVATEGVWSEVSGRRET